MNALAEQTLNGPVVLVHTLIEALQQEEEAMVQLNIYFNDQLDAIKDHDMEKHQRALHLSSEAVNTLGQLRAARERQVRLLGRILGLGNTDSLRAIAEALAQRDDLKDYAPRLLQEREAVISQARETREVCEQLDFALQYASSLGRELLRTMQEIQQPQVYTATGQATKPLTPRPLVNKVG